MRKHILKKRAVSLVLAIALAVVFILSLIMPAFAATTDDLRLYLGERILYDPLIVNDDTGYVADDTPISEGSGVSDIPNYTVGEKAPGRQGYVYTTMDSDDVVADGVSSAIEYLSANVAGNGDMNTVLQLLTSITSGVEVLEASGKADLLERVLAGEFKPVEQTVQVTTEVTPEGESVEVSEVIMEDGEVVVAPEVAPEEVSEIGYIGERLFWPLKSGYPEIISPYGDATVEPVHSITMRGYNGIEVAALFNCRITFVGENKMSFATHDGGVEFTYIGVQPLSDLDVTAAIRQNDTVGYALGGNFTVEVKVDGESKNLLEMWGEQGEDVFKIWRSMYPDTQLALLAGDSEYHDPDKELSRSYITSYKNEDGSSVTSIAQTETSIVESVETPIDAPQDIVTPVQP